MLKLQGACNMTFDSFVELYFESLCTKLKLNTINTKRHIFETKILPYFADKKINEIKATDIINWQNKFEKQRQYCYNKMRRCKEPCVMAELKSKRDDFTKTLSLLRKEVKVATNILEDNDEIKSNMKAEKAMQQKRFITKQKTRHRHDNLCR